MAGYCVSEAERGVSTGARSLLDSWWRAASGCPWSKSSHKKAHLYFMSHNDRFKAELRSRWRA